jgi:TolB-like protein/AraC-like DNA-binding protein/lipopolysaccharide biosynthesis regulator YciM
MQKEFIQKLTNLVEANLANEKFGPEDLAREAGMSHSNINRKLKIISNQNISQFIREIRLKKGKELLLNGDLTAAEISYRIGFGSPTYFNTCFREYFGVAPGELRNREPETEADNVPEEQQVKHIQKKSKTTNILIGLVILLLVLIPVSVFIANKISLSKETIEDKSIAVLPFKYLSDNPEKQYLADGLMDAILTKLSNIKDLRVVSRTSVEQYRESDKTAKVIGQELNVAYVLEGSFQKENNEVRLILQLIKTRDENHVWSNIYDRQWKDIFIVQSEVAETVASELHAIITPQEQQLIRKAPTANLTAYDFYQRGQVELEKYELGIKKDSIDLKRTQQLFQKALDLDSTFALAYSGLAAVSYWKYYWKTFMSDTFMDSVLIYVNKALVYDPQCADAYLYRAKVYSQISKKEEALKEVDKAIQFNPNDYRAYKLRSEIFRYDQDYFGVVSNHYEAMLRNHASPDYLRVFCNILVNSGYSDLGRKYLQQALELDGDSASHLRWLATIEYSDGNFENAYQIAKKNSDYYKDVIRFNALADYSLMTGRIEEAYTINSKMMESLKKSGEMDMFVPKDFAYCLLQKGRTNEAKLYINQSIQNYLEIIKLGRGHEDLYGAHFDMAEIYAFSGDKEKAYNCLDIAIKQPLYPRWWVMLYKHVPYFDSIRDEPRFQNILKVVEAKYQVNHERVGKWLEEKGLL